TVLRGTPNMATACVSQRETRCPPSAPQCGPHEVCPYSNAAAACLAGSRGTLASGRTNSLRNKLPVSAKWWHSIHKSFEAGSDVMLSLLFHFFSQGYPAPLNFPTSLLNPTVPMLRTDFS